VNRFDHEAKDWDKSARRQALAKAVAKGIIDAVPPGKYEILDIGCGTGLVSYNLIPIAKKIVGIDTSAAMVEEFNKKSPSPQIQAFQKSLRECGKSFDILVASMTLHHIQDLEEFFEEAAKRTNGYLFIADLWSEDGTFHDRGNEDVYHFGFDPHYLAKLSSRSGFEGVTLYTIYQIQKHRNFPVFLLGLQKISESPGARRYPSVPPLR